MTSFPDLPRRAECDSNADFIRRAIALLDQGRPLAEPETATEREALHRLLFCAGRHDVPMGRIFEGHVDAWQILHRVAAPEQIAALKDRDGPVLLGVWNAEGPDHHLLAEGGRITGGKSYATGAGILTHALVTSHAGTPDVQLHLVDLAQAPGKVDADWWAVSGMQASQTYRMRWQDAPVQTIGTPGQYEAEPWFSGGALRFCTVQTGGLAGLLDAVVAHLSNLGRTGDVVQQRRLATIFASASAAAALIRSLSHSATPPGAAQVANARNVTYDACQRGIALAQEACGTAAYFEANPVCQFAQDLGMYIRQPGPDAQMTRAGEAVAAGALDPWPCAD